jgi:hypothetical protein
MPLKIFTFAVNMDDKGIPLQSPIIAGNIPIKELLMLLIGTAIEAHPVPPEVKPNVPV